MAESIQHQSYLSSITDHFSSLLSPHLSALVSIYTCFSTFEFLARFISHVKVKSCYGFIIRLWNHLFLEGPTGRSPFSFEITVKVHNCRFKVDCFTLIVGRGYH